MKQRERLILMFRTRPRRQILAKDKGALWTSQGKAVLNVSYFWMEGFVEKSSYVLTRPS